MGDDTFLDLELFDDVPPCLEIEMEHRLSFSNAVFADLFWGEGGGGIYRITGSVFDRQRVNVESRAVLRSQEGKG